MILYIIENKSFKKYYIGVTQNLERRLKEHNSSKNTFTGNHAGKWEIIFLRQYKINTDAYKEEKRLKKAKNKNYIQWYIRAASSTGRATPS